MVAAVEDISKTQGLSIYDQRNVKEIKRITEAQEDLNKKIAEAEKQAQANAYTDQDPRPVA